MDKPAGTEIDVVVLGPGFGESILVHIGEGGWIVVDSCLHGGTGRPAALVYLEQIGVDAASSVELICASHWHDDHVGGLSQLLEQCPNAKFACAAALTRSQFVKLASVLNKSRSVVGPRGTGEIYRAYAVLEQRHQIPIRLVANLPFFKRSGADTRLTCNVTALSPSDAEFDRFLRSMAAAYPIEGGPMSFRVPDPSPNDLSVAIWVQIGDIDILLGADVEEHGDAQRGWSAIIGSRRGTRPATLFKIAHHGSITGHHNEIWVDLLIKDPMAVLTPWNRGSKLPTAADCARIRNLTPNAFVTSRSRAPRGRRRASAIDKTLSEGGIVITAAEPPTGFVQFRASIENLRWSVHLSPEAGTIDQFAA